MDSSPNSKWLLFAALIAVSILTVYTITKYENHKSREITESFKKSNLLDDETQQHPTQTHTESLTETGELLETTPYSLPFMPDQVLGNIN